jgi:hypothetical protein
MMLSLLLLLAVPAGDAVEVPESVATQAFLEWRKGQPVTVAAVDRVTNDDAVVIVRQTDGSYLSVRVDMDRAQGTTKITTAPVKPPTTAPSPFLGRFKGESICLANKPVCKDEVVVYTVEHAWSRERPLRVQADKIVNGAQEMMGILDCAVEGHTVTCPVAGGSWTLTLDGDRLEGGGTWHGVRVRKISATRAKP